MWTCGHVGAFSGSPSQATYRRRMPWAWRGAAFTRCETVPRSGDNTSGDKQNHPGRRLPGITQRNVFAQRFCSERSIRVFAMELPNQEPFSGAAC